LINVLNNSIDALHDAVERRITIDARPLGAKVVLNVSDTGSGFVDPGKVFDPFFTTKAPGKGTGLGLSICYGIIKQQGGEITVSNIHPHGACVTIEVPIAQQGVITSSAVAAAAQK
jgi:two-component system, NtrC family, sensor kinase